MLEGETVRETCGTHKRYTEAKGKPTIGARQIILVFWKFVHNDTRRSGTVERGLLAQLVRKREESLREKRKRK